MRLASWRQITVFLSIALLMGVAYYGAARIGLAMLDDTGVAVFWPASGVAVGVLLVSGRGMIGPVALGVAAATIAANFERRTGRNSCGSPSPSPTPLNARWWRGSCTLSSARGCSLTVWSACLACFWQQVIGCAGRERNRHLGALLGSIRSSTVMV